MLVDELGSRVVVQPDPNRVRAAQQVLKQKPEVDVFLLDDGFQHRQVRRELDVVLIDATDPFGSGRMLPRGLLREPRQALGRAGAVLVTRADQVDGDELSWIDMEIAKFTGRRPLAHVAHRWIGFRDAQDQPLPITHLQRVPAQGVCAIGNPRAFAATLGHHVAGKLPPQVLPDHHRYSARELEAIFAKAQAAGAAAVVTTEKDWVKWKPLLPAKTALPVYRPVLRLNFIDGGEALDALLQHTVTRSNDTRGQRENGISI